MALRSDAGSRTLVRYPNTPNIFHNTSLTSFSTRGELKLTPIQKPLNTWEVHVHQIAETLNFSQNNSH